MLYESNVYKKSAYKSRIYKNRTYKRNAYKKTTSSKLIVVFQGMEKALECRRNRSHTLADRLITT